MKSFFLPKTARVKGLATLSPMDERSLALRLSEEQVFPPIEEAAEAAELQRAALAFYTAANFLSVGALFWHFSWGVKSARKVPTFFQVG